ncbi:MAG: alanine--tRNA ligase [Coriobacteriales bacterium]|jgi:alanyl-tRNA synthetase|nr:alanine--tRNA ligase [Coriobacteriales bacterium]
MQTAELREKYLAFFESKGCKRMPSSSLIPDDPSMLLTSAGMVQFKPYFLQQKQLEAPYSGTTTVQKCVRTTDIDIIGTTGRHLSFFEMLGNFAFGTYFKREMCAWAYEFATEVLGFATERLYYTVYVDDDETFALWEGLGVEKSHITRLGREDNFWVAGDTGPCGPCSELYYDQGPEFGCGREDCAPGCDCDRYIEFWNLVFTQYDLQEDGRLIDLPTKNIDTGLGLERTAALLQGVQSNYETDLLRGLIAVGERLSGRTYTNSFSYGSGEGPTVAQSAEQLTQDLSLRILADHSRALTFLIGDGILPANEGRGYVLRRLLRRALRHGMLLGIEGPFLGEFIDVVIAEMGAAYPEITENSALIHRIVASGEERFALTLEHGQGFLDEHLDGLQRGDTLTGGVAFELHDRFGFPLDLTVEIAAEQGIAVDRAGFDELMREQQSQGRAHAKGDAWSSGDELYENLLHKQGPTEFVGYTHAETAAEVVALIAEGQSVTEITSGQAAELILNRTPFYAEKGGQLGDTGVILSTEGPDAPNHTDQLTESELPDNPDAPDAQGESAATQVKAPTGIFTVEDTQLRAGGIVAHLGHIDGTLRVGSTVRATIDTLRRERIERNHTATHLLHHALQEVLGEHIKQAGSLVAPERLRFDFTHFEPLSREQLTAVEQLVNTLIMEDGTVTAFETSLELARASGVTALFGEKYGERVRVLEAGPHSRELCGGTHVSHTAQIGLLKIVSESSVGASLRRIEAVTSFDALDRYKRAEDELGRAAALLKTTPDEVFAKVEAQLERLREAEAELARLKSGAATDKLSEYLGEAVHVANGTDASGQGYQLLILRQDGLGGGQLRETADFLRQKLGDASAGVLGSRGENGMPSRLAAATSQAVAAGFDAGALIRELAPLVGGRGGGKPSMAQAGGKDAQGLDAALTQAHAMLRSTGV